jgi:hypothetical protein
MTLHTLASPELLCAFTDLFTGVAALPRDWTCYPIPEPVPEMLNRFHGNVGRNQKLSVTFGDSDDFPAVGGTDEIPYFHRRSFGFLKIEPRRAVARRFICSTA